MTTVNANNAQKPIISAEVAEEITAAFHVIYRAMATYGSPLPTTSEAVAATGAKDWERGAARGFAALAARQAWVKEQEVAAFRQGVRDAIQPHIDAAREEKEGYDAAKAGMSEKVAKLLAPFPTFVLVPLSDVSDVFGAGVEIPSQVKKLTDMGYKVSKGANGAFSLRIDLPKSITGEK